MPLPQFNNKKEKDYMQNCMSNPKMNSEFPDQKQRAAVFYTKWKKTKGTLELDINNQENLKEL